MTWSAAHIAHLATSPDFSNETVEQLSVKRLMLKLVENAAGVLGRETIIAFANLACEVVPHTRPS